ncbi:MAG: valine--tRNA ligase, partial [Deltaproteobacteria bacterium]|nr:valine--tRNA ligase [Deltaproteobacteria bacterium]
IADEYVDVEFGTGCLKVTPAHDMNDFELGRKHSLEVLQVIDGDGRMTSAAGEAFAGLERFECRKRVLAALEEQKLLRKSSPLRHNVGHCYRCRTRIEPYVSPQWFVRAGPLAKAARDAVSDGRTAILPNHWEKTYFEWLDNIRDWCISRQIWWGHRIPAWTCQECGRLIVAREDPSKCPDCSSAKLVQDEDVLDTWFSSALWPFSTLGWPDRTPELKIFYPTSVLVTGFDILFFWVARMMMMGLHFMDEVPFRHVYIHALVRDQHGQKMSKSKGNVIDPLETIDKFGTDAFRFTLTAFAAMGRDIKMSEDRIAGYRHFINKIWNAARFSLSHVDGREDRPMDVASWPLHHRWILHRLGQVLDSSAEALANYQFNEYAQGLYRFVWHEFCDWYLELIKPELYGEDEDAKNRARSCLKHVLQNVLILLHPAVPFVTQEIWSHVGDPNRGSDLALEPYPVRQAEFDDPRAQELMELFQDVVTAVRNIRSELGINPSQALDVLIRAEGDDAAFLDEYALAMAGLARLGRIEVGPGVKAPKASASAVVRGHEVHVPLAGAVDFDAELERLAKELAKLTVELDRVRAKLANENFTGRAPAEVVEKEKVKAEGFAVQVTTLERLRDRLLSVRDQ